MSTHEERLRRPSPIRSLELGDLKVTYVPDGVVRLKPYGWLPGTTERDWSDNAAYLDDTGNLVASIGGLLVEHGERALLIDAGVGPLSQPDDPGNPRIGAIGGGDLLDNLAKLGRRPEEIEAVAFTHLHLDHIGWAWHPAPGSDRPAFTGADYLFAEPEWDQRHLSNEQGTTNEMLAGLAPHVRTVREGEEIFPGVRVLLTPGHTAGHTTYMITSGDRRLIAFGDALHTSAQIRHPDWSAAPDLDSAESTVHRHRLVKELMRPDTIGFGGHFADVVFGRVDDTADGPIWVPVA
ncbi:MBL fold metallo-hydrolase [Nonomuraea sp. B19D2]|uniref:MBL fold metallo-hydrolase n=1 Tax=Nonomuraea sp. B19D2 TaxID=3159561 RepID=UPI0032DA7083